MRKEVLFRSVFLGFIGVWAAAAPGLNIETVPVGHPGNPGDTRYPDTENGVESFGAVAYPYNIGRYEVTAGQYCEFLNAVASTDTYGLYEPHMGDPTGWWGCNIRRSGSAGTYTYTIGDGSPADIAAWANRPVNWVSYWDACRFANWLNNGQPTGPQDATTTEDGSYTLNGYTGSDGRTIQRNPGARWVVPSEDEWYKAAYHKNNGVTGDYWDFPTRTNEIPNNGKSEGDTGNSANFYHNGFAIGAPYYRSYVGFYALSAGPYGTFDQGGNVWEWNEAIVGQEGDTQRGLRGGSFSSFSDGLYASYRERRTPTGESIYIGFRVVEIPTSPHLNAFSIDNGAETTHSRIVTLNNACSSGPTEYLASESPDFAGASWQPYSTAPSFTLSTGKGVKTVYFKVRNIAGESTPVSDTITLSVSKLDFDEDADVDGADWDTFEACASGPGIPHNGAPVCLVADLDVDADVDQSDFAVLQRCYSGEDVPADPDCPF